MLADEPTNFISSPELWVDRHGDYLFDYAMMRLRSFAAAQDAVQETFLVALRGQHRFRGTVEERGWLVGIDWPPRVMPLLMRQFPVVSVCCFAATQGSGGRRA